MAKKYVVTAEVARDTHAKLKKIAKSKTPRIFVKELAREVLTDYVQRESVPTA